MNRLRFMISRRPFGFPSSCQRRQFLFNPMKILDEVGHLVVTNELIGHQSAFDLDQEWIC
jgi:hypothetical protein